MKHFKKIPEGSHQHDMMKHAAATLGSGNLRLAVQLPEGEDLNEWIAVNSEGGRECVCVCACVCVCVCACVCVCVCVEPMVFCDRGKRTEFAESVF